MGLLNEKKNALETVKNEFKLETKGKSIRGHMEMVQWWIAGIAKRPFG